MKVKSKNFKGIEYIQLSELPKEQLEILKKTLTNDIVIKILIGGKVQHDCIQFKDYVLWFDNVYKAIDIEPVDVTVKKIEPAKLVTK